MCMIQQENYEAAMLSMLLFVIAAMMFGHYKDEWISVKLGDEQETEAIED